MEYRKCNYLKKIKLFSLKKFQNILAIALLLSTNKMTFILANETGPEPKENFLSSIANNLSSINNKTIKYPFSDLSGSIPMRLSLILEELKHQPLNQENDLLLNRLLLYGPPGNGKSTYAKKIAYETGSILLEIGGPTIVSPLQGSGSEMINQIFLKAQEVQKEHNKRMVIFIDEADAISTNNLKDKRIDNEAAIKTLWLYLDKIKKNPNFYIILATNNINNINPTLLDRFGDNIIEIPNPNSNMRKEVIDFFSKTLNLPLNCFDTLSFIGETEGLSIRAIEDMFRTAKRDVGLIKNNQSIFSVLNEKLKIHKLKINATKQNGDNNQPMNLFQQASYILTVPLLLAQNYIIFKAIYDSNNTYNQHSNFNHYDYRNGNESSSTSISLPRTHNRISVPNNEFEIDEIKVPSNYYSNLKSQDLPPSKRGLVKITAPQDIP